MPTYDYQCRACGTVTEVIHSMLEGGPSTCQKCGGDLRRVLYPTGIIFKGSGFYRNDSRASASGSARSTATDTPGAAPSSSDSGSTGDGKATSAPSEPGSSAGGDSSTKSSTSDGS